MQRLQFFLEYEIVKDNLIKQKKIDEKLKKGFKNTLRFFKNDINKLILLLKKGVCPYEYMDEWEKFSKIVLPKKGFAQ